MEEVTPPPPSSPAPSSPPSSPSPPLSLPSENVSAKTLKRRDRLPKAFATASEQLGYSALLAIACKKIPIPINFFEPLSILQVS